MSQEFQVDKQPFVKEKSWESASDSDVTSLQRRMLTMLKDISLKSKNKSASCRVESAVEVFFKKWRDESEIAKHLAGLKSRTNKSKVAASASLSETMRLLTLKP